MLGLLSLNNPKVFFLSKGIVEDKIDELLTLKIYFGRRWFYLNENDTDTLKSLQYIFRSQGLFLKLCISKNVIYNVKLSTYVELANS